MLSLVRFVSNKPICSLNCFFPKLRCSLRSFSNKTFYSNNFNYFRNKELIYQKINLASFTAALRNDKYMTWGCWAISISTSLIIQNPSPFIVMGISSMYHISTLKNISNTETIIKKLEQADNIKDLNLDNHLHKLSLPHMYLELKSTFHETGYF